MAITHLMAGDVVLRGRSVRLADGMIAVMLPMILVGLLAWRRSAIGLIAAGAVVLIWTAANFFAFSQGIWLSAAAPPAIGFADWTFRSTTGRVLAPSSPWVQDHPSP
jgi:adenylate cyclase